MGSSGSTPALVANAPSVPDRTRYETTRPVTGSSESDRSRSDGGEQRGGNVDISV
jgi:hypothetical protein